VPRPFFESRRQFELGERARVEALHDRGPEAVVGQDSARLAFELREGPDALAGEKLL